MIGAREYATKFKTGQYGRLYIVSGSHARGRTFHIYILPEGEKAIPNGPNNPPLNKDAVEVYGIIGGQSGWSEIYGWLHKGKWQEDFKILLEEIDKKIAIDILKSWTEAQKRQEQKIIRIDGLLAQYNQVEPELPKKYSVIETRLGEASTIKELRRLTDHLDRECLIRFDTKGPIEVIYRYENGESIIILR